MRYETFTNLEYTVLHFTDIFTYCFGICKGSVDAEIAQTIHQSDDRE